MCLMSMLQLSLPSLSNVKSFEDFSDYSLFSLSNAVNPASTILKGRPTVFHFSSFCESLSKSSSLGTPCLTTKIKTSQRSVKMRG